MGLKLIPVENGQYAASDGKHVLSGKRCKSFNPGNKIKKHCKQNPLKGICMRLVHFINRGSKFTYQQVDDLIMTLQHSVLNLQKKKHEMMRDQSARLKKKRK